MTSLQRTIQMPFSVSLLLIFAYSVLLVAVPTDPNATEAEVAAVPETERRTALLEEPIVNAHAATLESRAESADTLQ